MQEARHLHWERHQLWIWPVEIFKLDFKLNNKKPLSCLKYVILFPFFLVQNVIISAFQIHNLTDICWDTCVTGSVSSKLGGRTETCLSDCAGRFVDTTLFLANRYAQLLQKSAGGH